MCFVYTAATRNLQYFLSYETGVYTRWSNITVPQTAVDTQTVGPEMAFWQTLDWNSIWYCMVWGCLYGYLENWVLSPYAWSPVELNELFGQSSDNLSTLSFYHKVSSWIKPGVYPTVYDVKGTLTSGALYNGIPADFVLI